MYSVDLLVNPGKAMPWDTTIASVAQHADGAMLGNVVDGNIVWSDIESLLSACGATITERKRDDLPRVHGDCGI